MCSVCRYELACYITSTKSGPALLQKLCNFCKKKSSNYLTASLRIDYGDHGVMTSTSCHFFTKSENLGENLKLVNLCSDIMYCAIASTPSRGQPFLFHRWQHFKLDFCQILTQFFSVKTERLVLDFQFLTSFHKV